MEQVYCILDYETRSEADLKAVGAYEYSKCPTTKILCASWRIGTKEELRYEIENKIRPKIWSPFFPNEGDDKVELLNAFGNRGFQLVAHNAFFEQTITRNVFFRNRLPPTAPMMPHERWTCTASMARALALPGNLEGACAALKLPIQKDMDGRRLILKYCKPRKPSKNNPAKWHNSARDLRRIMVYCQNDVDAETLLFLSLPELNPTERKVWLLDQKINFKGFATDTQLVTTALDMIAEENVKLTEETKKLCGLSSTNQRAAVLRWLETQGVFLPDLRAKTVSDAIKDGLVEGKAKRLLEIRQAISKTSTAKYQAFHVRSTSDGRVRDTQVYHTASTGRWGGAGVQPQNFPRGTIADTTLAAEVLKTGDLEWVRALYGNPMEVLSSCLRSVIVAPEERELHCADYAAIEARVLFWIANHEAGLQAFREGRPMYEEMAAIIYNIDFIENVTKLQRQVGKQAVLGCGYGMGWRKFMQTCANYSIEIDEEIAQVAVRSYRQTHALVPKLWSNLEKVAIAAVQRPGSKFKVNHTTWWVKNGFLWCELPSGRRLAYAEPSVRYEQTPWDEKRPVLYHYGVNPLTRKWASSSTYGGRLCENIVQAVSRDLMAAAMLRIDAAGFDIVLSVHDELLAERVKGQATIEQFESLMAELPSWASGCPVKVEGWNGPRYKK